MSTFQPYSDTGISLANLLVVIFRCQNKVGRWTKISLSAAAQRQLKRRVILLSVSSASAQATLFFAQRQLKGEEAKEAQGQFLEQRYFLLVVLFFLSSSNDPDLKQKLEDAHMMGAFSVTYSSAQILCADACQLPLIVFVQDKKLRHPGRML